MGALPASSVLAVWEKGRRRAPLDRTALLHALAVPDADPDGLLDEPLGRRNAALLAFRRAAFGDLLRGYVDCPRCASRLEFELDGTPLAATAPARPLASRVEGLRFRVPTGRDLASLAGTASVEDLATSLLRRCAIDPPPGTDAAQLAGLLDRAESVLEEADPLADMALGFRCHACQHAWTASLDLGAFLWEEIDACAARLLDEVHTLAAAYGWSEAAILELSEARRAAYLERVQG